MPRRLFHSFIPSARWSIRSLSYDPAQALDEFNPASRQTHSLDADRTKARRRKRHAHEYKARMIQGLSRAVTLYLAPLLSLTALLLTLFAYLAPVIILQSQVALLVVSPSAELTQPGRSANVRVDGATIRFGALGMSAFLSLSSRADDTGRLVFATGRCVAVQLHGRIVISNLRCAPPRLIPSRTQLTAATQTSPSSRPTPRASSPRRHRRLRAS